MQPIKYDPRLWQEVHFESRPHAGRTPTQHLQQFAAWLTPRRHAVRELSIGGANDSVHEAMTESEVAALGSVLGAVAGSASIEELDIIATGYPQDSEAPNGGAQHELDGALLQLPRLAAIELWIPNFSLAGSLQHLGGLTKLRLTEMRVSAALPPSLQVLIAGYYDADYFHGTPLPAIPGPLPQLEYLGILAFLDLAEGEYEPLDMSALGQLAALTHLSITAAVPQRGACCGYMLHTGAPGTNPLAGLTALVCLERLTLCGVHADFEFHGQHGPLQLNTLQDLQASAAPPSPWPHRAAAV